jgi:hypothetical protein
VTGSIDGYAKASLICALFGLLPTCGIVLGPVAVVLGSASLNRIRASGGLVGGSGLATAGRIIGGAVTVFWLLVVVLYYVFIVDRVRRAG